MSNIDSIWLRSGDIGDFQRRGAGTLADTLGVVFTEKGADYLCATMLVDAKLLQPMGILNGGASAALAETVASTAANYCVSEDYYCVGTQVTANHLRPISSGAVLATARPLHLGRRTQLWEVKITDKNQQLICDSRMMLQVLSKK